MAPAVRISPREGKTKLNGVETRFGSRSVPSIYRGGLESFESGTAEAQVRGAASCSPGGRNQIMSYYMGGFISF
jgi:hypothetical protein